MKRPYGTRRYGIESIVVERSQLADEVGKLDSQITDLELENARLRETLRLIYGEISPSAAAGDERWAAANLTNITQHLQDREPWLGDESDD